MAGSEVQRIRDSYGRRTMRYDPWNPWISLTRRELELRLIRSLRNARVFPPDNKTLIDVGCGTGSNLLFFLQMGFAPSRLYGLDLISDRIAAARARLPIAVQLCTTEASGYDGVSCAFDVVFHSMLFSSVLDEGMRQRVAANMWRMVRPGGGVLWYDFTWNNPRNPDVRGVRVAEIKSLFPNGSVSWSRVTLAPPISRFIGRYCEWAYGIVNSLAFLRTHVVAWIEKPVGSSP